MPQRTEFAAVSFRSAPVGCFVGRTPGAYEPLGELATWHTRAPAQHQQRAFGPSQQPPGATGLLNGGLVANKFSPRRPFLYLILGHYYVTTREGICPI